MRKFLAILRLVIFLVLIGLAIFFIYKLVINARSKSDSNKTVVTTSSEENGVDGSVDLSLESISEPVHLIALPARTVALAINQQIVALVLRLVKAQHLAQIPRSLNQQQVPLRARIQVALLQLHLVHQLQPPTLQPHHKQDQAWSA